jgi:hypothetical protein
MFSNCTNLSLFNSDYISLYEETKNISRMFENCKKLTELPTTFIFPKTLVNCKEAFKNCEKLYWDW